MVCLGDERDHSVIFEAIIKNLNFTILRSEKVHHERSIFTFTKNSQVSLTWKSHEQRSYNPWGCTESDMTEHTHALDLLAFLCIIQHAASQEYFLFCVT